MKGNSGTILSTDTDITFYFPNIFSVEIDGIPAGFLKSKSTQNSIKIHLTKGTHQIKLIDNY